MSRLLFKSLLALCVVLFSGYSQLHAHAYVGAAHHPSAKVSEKSAHPCFDSVDNTQSLGTPCVECLRGKSLKIEATEGREEEDEYHYSISGKNLEGSDYFPAIFCAHIRAYFFTNIQEVLASCMHLPDISSDGRYLLLRVFRI
jgi:hypothetical protein